MSVGPLNKYIFKLYFSFLATKRTSRKSDPQILSSEVSPAAPTVKNKRQIRSRASLASSSGNLKDTGRRGKKSRPSIMIPLTPELQGQESPDKKESADVVAIDEGSKDSEVLFPGSDNRSN